MAKQLISKAVGIDLGTTNSAVAVMTLADTDIIIHSDTRTRRETTPSCVWKDPRARQKIVGVKALQRVGTSPEPIRSIKRDMGKSKDVQLSDEIVRPEEISALILQEMKRQIEEDVARFATEGSEWVVQRAIVTVPAYFDHPQIEATRRAAEMAGLEVLELLHEPTAAASYYCWQNNVQDGVFLVYDFGGGTFDVSILRCKAGWFTVLGISGNNYLGGDDIDAKLAEDIRQKLVTEGYALNLDVKNDEDRYRFEKLKHLAEGMKKALSTEDDFVLRSQSYLQDKLGVPVNIDLPFERGEIEELIRPCVERTIPYCYQALELARQKEGVTLADIDAIIFAGGTTHIPLVREIVRSTFCADPAFPGQRARCSHPTYQKVDTIVALGAAIRAAASGGIDIYDAKRAVRVAFKGISSTATKHATVGGRVEALHAGLDLRGGSIQLRINEMGYKEEVVLKTEGAFSFKAVPLQSASENLLIFEVCTDSGKPVATVTRSLFQSPTPLRPTGGFSGTALLSKTLYLEVIREGRLFRKELIKALTTLPTSAEYEFSHPGQTLRLRFPLYQQQKLIKEIIVENLPMLPEGTPVRFKVDVDELAGLTVKGLVGNRSFDARIDPPAERKPPTPAELQALVEDFQEELQKLPPEERRYIEAQFNQAKESFATVIMRGETAQALHDFEEMEEVLANIKRRGPTPVSRVEPPLAVFEEIVNECHSLNHDIAILQNRSGQASQGEPEHNVAEATVTIHQYQSRGRQAFSTGDQISYEDVLNALKALRDRLKYTLGRYYAIQPPDTRSPVEQAQDLGRYVIEEVRNIEQLAKTCGRSDIQTELQRIQGEIQAAIRDIMANPLLARRRLYGELDKIEHCKKRLESSLPMSGAPELPEESDKKSDLVKE